MKLWIGVTGPFGDRANLIADNLGVFEGTPEACREVKAELEAVIGPKDLRGLAMVSPLESLTLGHWKTVSQFARLSPRMLVLVGDGRWGSHQGHTRAFAGQLYFQKAPGGVVDSWR